jgi:RimK family alpha-L-glutamate ligase
MHVVILGKGGWHADDLCRAIRERGHDGCVLPYESLTASFRGRDAQRTLTCEGTSVFEADAVLARFIPAGSLEQIIYRVDALHWIEEHGVPVMNSPGAIERSVDKFYSDARLREAGLPTPETVVCERFEDAMTAVRAMLSGRGPDEAVLIKPIFGSMGHGIVRVSDPDVAFRVLQSLDQLRAVFYVQRAIDSGGRDIRVFVVGGRVLGAIKRRCRRRTATCSCSK